MQEAAGGGALFAGDIGAGVCAALAFFSRRNTAAPVGPVAPLCGQDTPRGGSSFPWGKRFLLVFAHPGPMGHRPRGKAGWEMNHW